MTAIIFITPLIFLLTTSWGVHIILSAISTKPVRFRTSLFSVFLITFAWAITAAASLLAFGLGM